MTHKNFLLIFAVIVSLFLAREAPAAVSVNVPIGHWSYEVIDKLSGLGLIRTTFRGTRPFTRSEMARLILEARREFEKNGKSKAADSISDRNHLIRVLLDRLEREFRADLDELAGRTGIKGYVKPLEDAYVRYIYADKDFKLENEKGQSFAKASNIRAGLSTHGVILRHLAFYLNPEYRYSENTFSGKDSDLEILEGYGKLEWINLELEIGRDSLWWGPGHHGSLILTDNAKPFDLVKLSNPKPILLPWILKRIGLLKFVAFWTELEKDRSVPETELLGFRVNIKPFPFLDIGASRTVMFGGEGRKGAGDLSLGDWGRVLSGKNISGQLDTNQIGGLDFDLHFPSVDRWIPFVGAIDLWFEWYGEDEAGGLPSKEGYVAGLKFCDLLLTGKTDLVIEYAQNVISGRPGLWYSHHIYRTGYRYEGDIMGHSMGGDARDYFLRLDHYLSPDMVIGMDYNHQQRGVESLVTEDRDRFDVDVTWYRSERLLLKGGYRFEAIDNIDQTLDLSEDNHILSLLLNYSF